MKQFMIRRVLPVILTISILLPCVTVFVSAADGVMYDTDSVQQWNTVAVSPGGTALDAAAGALLISLGVNGWEQKVFWTLVNMAVGEDVGEVEYLGLEAILRHYNSAFVLKLHEGFFQTIFRNTVALVGLTFSELFGFDGLYFNIVQDGEIYRIKDTGCTGFWIVDQQGRYPYAWVNDQESQDEPTAGDHWRPAHEVLRYLVDTDGVGDYTDRGTLEAVKQHRINNGDEASIKKIPGFDMEAINKPGYYWCNADGQPYFCFPDEQVAVEQDRPLTEITFEDGSSMIEFTEGTDVGIDMDNMIVVLPDATIQPILDVTYNPSTFTYDVTTYDINNYDVTYEYTFEYHLQYTYVTYIGETDDFDAYKCYYELPDGRNSADLTREELEQLSVAIDVVEYSRATDDVRIRALYHFDGDTKDSSYWNHMSDFEWSNAPSISYMESDPFDGALYLDGSVTSTMNFYLPTDLGSGDFTIQFRYYQGQVIAEDYSIGLYLNASSTSDEWQASHDDDCQQLLALSGKQLRPYEGSDGGGEVYPVGSWFEVCITRQGDVFTYYLNGQPLIVTEAFAGEYFNNRILFHFESDAVAYAMIDELRVLNFAIGSGKGSYYEPSAVPHDTNLALVIPEDKVALADEYWTFHCTSNLLSDNDLHNWTDMFYDTSAFLTPFDSKFSWLSSTGKWSLQGADFDVMRYLENGPFAFYNSDFINLNMSHAGTTLDLVYDRPEDLANLSYTAGYATGSGFNLPAAAIYIPLGDEGTCWISDGTYTFSVATGDGKITSKTFEIENGTLTGNTYSQADGYIIGVYHISASNGFDSLFVGFNPATMDEPTKPILYMCLTKGSSTGLTAEFHESVSVVDKDDAFRPTLAVRTDLEVTDFQIGGVRPAIPSKGLVYALVESGYIRSLQIYNGQAWEGVDGRIWTGERWIPYGSYNVITLQDMYDIVDSTDNFEYIYTETGFWTWWQKSWNEFTGKLFGLLGGDKESLDQPIVIVDPENEDDLTFLEFLALVIDGGKAVVKGIRQLFSGVVSTVPDAVTTLTNAFEPGGMAVGLVDGSLSDPDADYVGSPIMILRQPPKTVTVESGQTAEISVLAHGHDLTYTWYWTNDVNVYGQPYMWRSNSIEGYEFGSVYEVSASRAYKYYKCVIMDTYGNVVESDIIEIDLTEPAAVFSLRGFRDTDSTDYYETEVLDPWRYR